jgi:hypothetical protein
MCRQLGDADACHVELPVEAVTLIPLEDDVAAEHQQHGNGGADQASDAVQQPVDLRPQQQADDQGGAHP